jgi:malonate decarboxylase delta subunit
MEKLQFSFPAGPPAQGRALAGVVGSGDLEVLLEPGAPGTTAIVVSTSVDGCRWLWQAVLERTFTDPQAPALAVEINDFGATPGVVGVRINQALSELNAAGKP